MLSSEIFGDSASGDKSKTVLFARPAEYLLQPSPIESGIDVCSPSLTGNDVAFKFHIMDDFEKLKKEMLYEMPVSKDENHSHGTILSDSDSIESLRNGFIVNSSQNVFDVHTEGSEGVLLQDRNFQNISATSWQSDNSPAREKDGLVNLENVEELIDLFVEASETEEDVEREEPLFSLLDVYCPLDNQETSLFPPTASFSSSTVTDCSDNISSSFMDYSEKSLTSYAVCCSNNLPGHFSNERTTLDYRFGYLLTSDTPSDVSPYTAEPALQPSEQTLGIDGYVGSMPELRCKKRARSASKSRSSRKHGKSCIKQTTDSFESEVLSVSEMQNNSFCFEKLSEIEPEGLPLCSLSQKASEQVRLAASGNGYVSEFAKFIHSRFSNRINAVEDSESPPAIINHSVSQTNKFQNPEIHILERQSKRNFVRSKSKEDSQDCLVDLSFTTKQTSSKRFIQKPACACCMKMGKDSYVKKVNNSRKRLNHPAKHQGRVKDTAKSRQHLQYMVVIDAYTTCQEQLQSLQRKLFRLLHILFPFLAVWKYIRPHSHSLELLIDEITDSLKNSTHKRKAGVWQPCCPTVTLCRFPALCLRSLQQKAVVLINLLIPSLHIGDKEHGQLETIIDQLISSNANANCVQTNFH